MYSSSVTKRINEARLNKERSVKFTEIPEVDMEYLIESCFFIKKKRSKNKVYYIVSEEEMFT